MPVSIVVGGQYGSEGKGKVAQHLTLEKRARAVVRVGGTNSGHTAVCPTTGQTFALRQLPAARIVGEVLWPAPLVVLPRGSLIDIDILEAETEQLGLAPGRDVIVDPLATVITEDDKAAERGAGLREKLGSTLSGVGAALKRRIARDAPGGVLARDHDRLARYRADTIDFMTGLLEQDAHIVVEGTQGFGLSVLDTEHWPKATSRVTTADGFFMESRLPLRTSAIDEVAMVLRTYPIRVAGESGRLENETTWDEVARRARRPSGWCEYTTATNKVRRVGEFEFPVVKEAIRQNAPNRIVLNHMDYIDPDCHDGVFAQDAMEFVDRIETGIGQPVDLLGTGPADFVRRQLAKVKEAA